jgi:hypothetical protein
LWSCGGCVIWCSLLVNSWTSTSFSFEITGLDFSLRSSTLMGSTLIVALFCWILPSLA